MNQYFTNLVLKDVSNFEGFRHVKNYNSDGGYYIYSSKFLELIILFNDYNFKIISGDDADELKVVETFEDLGSAVDFIETQQNGGIK